MTYTPIDLVSKPGKLRRFVATVFGWLQALEYTSFDYTQDRIDGLEQKVAGLTKELQEIRASSPRDSAPH